MARRALPGAFAALAALLFLLACSVPAAAGATFRQDVGVALASQAGPVALVAGDLGTATLGTSATAASVGIPILPPLLADDVLRLDSADSAWQVQARLVSQSGWGLLESITVQLWDGTTTADQVVISAGTVTQSSGLPVDLPTGATDTQLRVVGTGTGTATVMLEVSPDAGGPVIAFQVVLAAG